MKQGLRKTIFSAISLLAGMALYGQAPINRLYGTYSTETGIAGFVTADSSIYAVGTSSAFTDMSSQVYLLKTDKEGNLLWSKFFGGTGVDDAADMYFDGDSTIYIIANSYIDAAKGYDVKIIKAYTSGTLVWEKNIGSAEWDLGKRLIHMSNNSFVVCGHTYGNSMGLADGMLMAFDENGDSLWFKNTGDARDNFLLDLRERSADTVVACGVWHTAGIKKAWLAEYSISTGTVTNYFYGSAYNRTFNAIDTMPNGHYAIGYTTDSAAVTHTEMGLMEISDDTHDVLFEMTMYGPNDEECADIMFYNGEYNIMGNTNSYGLGGTDIVVYRYDMVGNYGGSNTFGTSSDEYGRYIMPNNNGTFTLIGTAPNGFGASDLWIVNVDSIYELTDDVPDEFMDVNSVAENGEEYFGLKAYPNPCYGILHLDWHTEPVSIAVYNYTGHIVLQPAPAKTLDLGELAAGMYLVQVTGQNGQTAMVKLLLHAQR